jgi:hypothetical protein
MYILTGRGIEQTATDINMDRVVKANRYYGKTLGWQTYRDRIEDLLGFANYTPNDKWFAKAIICWQQSQGLPGSGYIEPATWSKMRTAIGLGELAVGATCYTISTPTITLPTIGFEFDLNYGASINTPPLDSPDYSLEGKKITTHRIATDGFRLEGDGNRIEIGTKPFELSTTGRTDMEATMKAILNLAQLIRKGCSAVKPDKALGYGSNVGAPRYFKPSFLESTVQAIFPLAMKRPPYYQGSCIVAAAPQVTFEIPLAKINALVTLIQKSEGKKVAGKALSGSPGWRQGVRSQAIYDAQKAVNKSRDAHIKSKTKLSNGDVVTEINFTPTLQGLLILMVSYLRTSVLLYTSKDYEGFAKSYLPVNVKNPFRLLFADLTTGEKQVFKELYGSLRVNLWRLAKDAATNADKDNQLFPAIVKQHQECWFTTAPTWDEFVDKTITNTPLLRSKFCPGKVKKGEDVGCEVLFAPLSRIIPYKTGSRRVTVELRRLGFNWVSATGFTKDGVNHPGWLVMTQMLFDIALALNK